MVPRLLSPFSCLTVAAASQCGSIDFLLFVCSVANCWAGSITPHSPGGERAELAASRPLPLTEASVKTVPPCPGACVSQSALGGRASETVAFSRGLGTDERWIKSAGCGPRCPERLSVASKLLLL